MTDPMVTTGSLPQNNPMATTENPPQSDPMNLADMFSFDIGQFLDDEDKELPSTARAPISDDLKNRLTDIANRLESSLEYLVEDCTPIRVRTRLDELAVEPIVLKNRLEELRRLEAELESKLKSTRQEIQEVETGIAASPKAIEDQTAKLKASAKYLATLSKSLKPIPGSTADDAQAIEDI
uniref:OO_Ba0005L10-OO_Ba0081K17.20 protein n=1 Tax=Oryza officinalis TaxID=4535 RepID=D0ABC4_9ORYZ|nr:OO_Ba0005L10-OO_Ba0081K17.20 [Oryza officinalis]